MNKYKVVEQFEIDEVVQEVGSEVELTDAHAEELGSKVELVVAEEVPAEEESEEVAS